MEQAVVRLRTTLILVLLATTGCESETLKKSFYGNTIQDWLYAGLIALGGVIAGKIIYFFIQRVVKRLAERTQSRLDDILVDMMEEPFVFAVTIGGFWQAAQALSMSPSAELWFSRVFYVLIIFSVAWLVTRTFDALVTEYVQPLVAKSEGDLDDQLLPVLRRGIKAIVWIVAVIVGLNNAGYDVGAVLASLGIGGLAFALAAQDTVANLFGGFTIFTDRPFTVKERIKVAGFDGIVEEIGVRSTRIRTLDGRLVTIPNSKIVNDPIENISSEPSRKVALDLGLTYDMNERQIGQALELLADIANTAEGVEGEPITAFTGFGDFALNIKLIYFIEKDADIFGTMTRINREVLRRYADAGLDMAFPTQTLHVQGSGAAPAPPERSAPPKPAPVAPPPHEEDKRPVVPRFKPPVERVSPPPVKPAPATPPEPALPEPPALATRSVRSDSTIGSTRTPTPAPTTSDLLAPAPNAAAADDDDKAPSKG